MAGPQLNRERRKKAQCRRQAYRQARDSVRQVGHKANGQLIGHIVLIKANHFSFLQAEFSHIPIV